jgi:hypothetical protein
MTQLSMDFITGLPESRYRGQLVDSILVIVDRFSKYSFFYPVATTITAAELAELFYQEIELAFGPPQGIVSDRGPVFTSAFWSALCYHSQIKRRLSTAFHPQTDGQTERMNQTLEHYLRCFTNDQQTNWPQLLKTAQYACNNAANATIGMSPTMCLYGWQPEFRLDIEGDIPGKRVPGAKARIEKLEEVRQQLRAHWERTTEGYKRQYDKKHQPLKLKRGDFVGLSTRNLRFKQGARKLQPRYIGPFRVLEKIGLQAYRLALPDKYSRLHNVFPISLLEPWKQRDGGQEVLPMPDLEDEAAEWEVEDIRDKKRFDGETHYLVQWKGWPSEYNQWVPMTDMGNASRLVQKYEKSTAARKANTSRIEGEDPGHSGQGTTKKKDSKIRYRRRAVN